MPVILKPRGAAATGEIAGIEVFVVSLASLKMKMLKNRKKEVLKSTLTSRRGKDPAWC
jgi:hypothetical protein